MDLPPDLLQRSPEEISRRIVLTFLDEAGAAIERLDDPEDDEALHDFRVAVRRTRSTFRAWRKALKGSVRKRHRKALEDLQRSTGSGRDAEVALEWLTPQRRELGATQRRGLVWMIDRLRRRHRDAMADARSGVREGFAAVEADLREAIGTLQVSVCLARPRPRDTFAGSLASKADAHLEELLACLGDIGSLGHVDACHRTRIRAKRLRYLVEPMRIHVPEAARVVKLCKRLQDVLGDLNDCHVLREDLGVTFEEAVVEQADRPCRPGLLEMTRRVQRRAEGLYETLDTRWLSNGGERLAQAVRKLVRALERASKPTVEVERKYLLKSLPDMPEGAREMVIDQGWLPGKAVRERLRRRVERDSRRYFRTVKIGVGLQRTELEEETTPEVFEALWSLTEGCRVRKRRFAVPDGDVVWEVDEFLDRELYLAEVELDDPADEVVLPAWLEGHVVREVTGDGEYVNLNLAR